MTFKTRFGFVLVLLVAFALNSAAQSLADIARKERERQRQVRSGVTIVSVPQGVPATTSATTSSITATPAGSATAAKPSGPVDNQGRDEKYWRGAFQKARDDARRAEARIAITDSKLKELNTQLLQNSAIYNREYQLGPQITQMQKELDTARKEAEQAKQKISDLEEELRRSNGLPGWAR